MVFNLNQVGSAKRRWFKPASPFKPMFHQSPVAVRVQSFQVTQLVSHVQGLGFGPSDFHLHPP
jgi:hypothetical protein